MQNVRRVFQACINFSRRTVVKVVINKVLDARRYPVMHIEIVARGAN